MNIEYKLIFLLFWIPSFNLSYSQTLINHENKNSTANTSYQPQGKLLIALNQFNIVGSERKKFIDELVEKFVWDKNEEQIYLDELSKEIPVVVSKKLADNRMALVISIYQLEPVYSFVFATFNNKMSYIGEVDGDAHYKMFKPMIVEGPSKIFILVGNQTNSGTGIASYNYDIYQIDDKKLVSYGNIPLEGSSSGWQNYFNLDYKSEFSVLKNGSMNQLQVKVKYKFEIDLFEFTNTGGCFTDDFKDEDLYLFDDELNFNYDLQYFPFGNENAPYIKHRASADTELTNSRFLENHFQKLKILARTGKDRQKCWLKELLKDEDIQKMKDSKYRDELSAILNEKTTPIIPR